MKEKEARKILKELFERHCVPSIPIIFHPNPITTKKDISAKLEAAGLSNMADIVTVKTITRGVFKTNIMTSERSIEFYGLPTEHTIRHEFKHYLDHLDVAYVNYQRLRPPAKHTKRN